MKPISNPKSGYANEPIITWNICLFVVLSYFGSGGRKVVDITLNPIATGIEITGKLNVLTINHCHNTAIT